MSMRCGWPLGRSLDGPCGARPSVAYLVEAYTLPLAEPFEHERRALALCPDHDPLSKLPPRFEETTETTPALEDPT